MKNLNLYSDNLSIEQQTGCRRKHPKMLLQDINELLKITKYDYDLTDKDFTLYAWARGCMEGAGIPDFSDPDYQAHKEWMKETKIEETTPLNGDRGQWRRWVSEHWRTFEEFQASGDLSQALSGKFYSDEDRRSYWQCILIARAKLQDCWEIYQATEAKECVRAVA